MKLASLQKMLNGVPTWDNVQNNLNVEFYKLILIQSNDNICISAVKYSIVVSLQNVLYVTKPLLISFS